VISLRALADRDGPFCHYCRGEFNPQLGYATRDHVIPRSKGGSDDAENLVLCCGWCNQQKGDMSAEEFFEILPAQLNLRWGKDRSHKPEGYIVVPRKLQPQFPMSESLKFFKIKDANRDMDTGLITPSGAGECKGRYAAERFPVDEVDEHTSGWECNCHPSILSIKGGWHILRHHEHGTRRRRDERLVQ
jgi:hypothetical protein